ncbi:MAG: glutaredoxin family protein [Euryarchaeota archaeon]|nr:glutaredoxin family protein [Euryarchaeota archaeon]
MSQKVSPESFKRLVRFAQLFGAVLFALGLDNSFGITHVFPVNLPLGLSLLVAGIGVSVIPVFFETEGYGRTQKTGFLGKKVWIDESEALKDARPAVTLYVRSECALCGEAATLLEALQKEFVFDILEVDVDSDPALMRQYGDLVPVGVLRGEEIFRLRAEVKPLRKALKRRLL